MDSRPSPDPRRELLAILAQALTAVHGRRRVRERLADEPLPGPVALIAVGKAACAMAEGARDALGGHIADAFIVTKDGHEAPLPWPVWTAGHPIPDARSLDAGERLLAFIDGLPAGITVLVLLSGGASALVECLPAGVDLETLQAANRWLLASGWPITAVNPVRQRLSRIKAGRLAPRLAPRTVRVYAISDVPGDDPRLIGSGPLVAGDAGPAPETPAWLRAAMAVPPPAPAAGDACFARIQFALVGTLADARRAAAEAAAQRGHRAQLEPGFVGGPAVAAGRRLAQALASCPPGTVRIWGGETTVVLPPRPGHGGRNQSLALSAALALEGAPQTWLLAAGTDGSDGPGGDAGALVDGDSCGRGREAGLDPIQCLEAADAGSFLAASGDLIHTGPTGTNVMDLMLGWRG